MKKTVQSVKYVLDNLHLTPDELFQLIETSQGYTGDDYNRWLANQIILVAESEGIPFTELLVKKLKILAQLMSDADDGISELVDNFISENIDNVDTVYDFTGISYSRTTESVEEFDWFNGINLIDGTLSENNTDNSTYVGILDSKGIGKSEITLSAKSMGYSLSSKGAGMLLRFILMDDLLEPINNTYVFISDSAFFKENSEITEFFMQRFDLVKSVYLNKLDTMSSSFASGMNLITIWKSYSSRRESVDFISAESLVEGGKEKLFYANKSDLAIDFLTSSGDSISISEIDYDLSSQGTRDVEESPLNAYLSVNGTQSVADFPISGSSLVYPISKDNLEEIIVYFAASKSLEGTWGYGRGLGRVCNGLEGYQSLVANCLPIFLFSPNSLFSNSDVKSNFSYNSDLVNDLHDMYSPFMTFEAKVLWDLVKSYSDAMVNQVEGLDGFSFYQIRKGLNNEKFDSEYQKRYESAKNFVKRQLEGFLC